jgi:hypothetical protein
MSCGGVKAVPGKSSLAADAQCCRAHHLGAVGQQAHAHQLDLPALAQHLDG